MIHKKLTEQKKILINKILKLFLFKYSKPYYIWCVNHNIMSQTTVTNCYDWLVTYTHTCITYSTSVTLPLFRVLTKNLWSGYWSFSVSLNMEKVVNSSNGSSRSRRTKTVLRSELLWLDIHPNLFPQTLCVSLVHQIYSFSFHPFCRLYSSV